MPIFHAPELEWNLPCRFAGEMHQFNPYQIPATNTTLLQVGKRLDKTTSIKAMVKTIMKWSGVESEIGEF